MRIFAFSDLHASRRATAQVLEAAAEADLVIGAGDFCNMRQGLAEAVAPLAQIAAPLVLVPGNAESAEELRTAAPEGAVVLHGQRAEVAGLEIVGLGYGVPRTPFGPWSCDLDEAEAATLLAPFERADILVTHSPPRGHCDVTSQGLSVGSTAILAAIERMRPALDLCGHIHDSWGCRSQVGETLVANLGPAGAWFEL